MSFAAVGARVLWLLVLASGAHAQVASDSLFLGAPDTSAVVAPPDTSAAAIEAAADTSAAPPDTTAPAPPPWNPDPSFEALSLFRPGRSVDVTQVLFGSREDAVAAMGLPSLGTYLRLAPGVRTREMSQGPTAESFDLSGVGSGRSALLFRGAPFALPGTSGPHSHEIVLSEIDGFALVRGGASALYGPQAVDGAVVTLPKHPLPNELTTRVTVEEGVDDWQRGAFTLARRFGPSSGLFVSTESRRIEGFFFGTKEVDRHFAATFAARLPARMEGTFGLRRFEGDGRHGGFEFETIRSVLTKRDDVHVKLFRPTAAGGALLEADFTREKLETGIGGAEPHTREYLIPALRFTADLLGNRSFEATFRAEGRHVRLEHEEEGRVERAFEGGGALRVTQHLGPAFFTATARADREEGRPVLAHGRLEGEWSSKWWTLFAIASRGEQLPDRAALEPDEPEKHLGAEAGLRVAFGPLRLRGVAFARDVEDARREPTFEEIRARTPVEDAPIGDVEIRGATAGVDATRFPFPGLSFLGDVRLGTSVTWLEAEEASSGAQLPRRAPFSWTGEGFLERRLFRGELNARLGGRLTHLADRVDEEGEPVADAWVTDVLLEGEVGDAIFFFRFHDMLERADEIEPGIRLPGFSRMWGVSWRFLG